MICKRLVLSSLVLVFLFACKDDKIDSSSSNQGVVGEDGRTDCQDSAMDMEESKQWQWLQRGFRLSAKPKEYPAGEFRITILRREPKGVELLLQLERSGGQDQAFLVRPRQSLLTDFREAAMQSGLAVASLWTPKTPLDSLALPDSVAHQGFSLLETKGIQGLRTMRRCDTATGTPSALQEALYLIRVETAGAQQIHALRPGFYADSFWNSLQRLVDNQESRPAGVGF
jgi:hypothetical protein